MDIFEEILEDKKAYVKPESEIVEVEGESSLPSGSGSAVNFGNGGKW